MVSPLRETNLCIRVINYVSGDSVQCGFFVFVCLFVCCCCLLLLLCFFVVLFLFVCCFFVFVVVVLCVLFCLFLLLLFPEGFIYTRHFLLFRLFMFFHHRLCVVTLHYTLLKESADQSRFQQYIARQLSASTDKGNRHYFLRRFQLLIFPTFARGM